MKKTIKVMSKEEWADAKERKELFCDCSLSFSHHECKMVVIENAIAISIVIPHGKDLGIETNYEIFLNEDVFIIVGSCEYTKKMLKRLLKISEQKELSTIELLEQWFLEVLKDDFSYIQFLEKEISKMEETVLNGKCDDFHYQILPIKKILTKKNHYYGQLKLIGQELLNNNQKYQESFGKTDFLIFRERCEMLAQETQIIREYLMQVQEVYQSQIEIQQNNVMKTLTMVTTFFLPLTLIAGWYGMNFKYMPEIYSKWGYPITIGISILVVVIWLIISKKKKFW